MSPFQDCELLPKRKVFQEEVAARAKETRGQSTQKPQQTQHDADSIWTRSTIECTCICLI
jgi:hypothetical protein